MKLTTDELNFVNLLTPKDRNGATHATPCVNLKDYDSMIFLLSMGTMSGTLALTVEECSSAAAAGNTTIPFTYRVTAAATPDTVGNDTYGARTAVTAASQPFALGALDQMLLAIEIKSADLDDGYPYVRLSMVASAAATLTSCIAVMKPRYPQKSQVTALS